MAAMIGDLPRNVLRLAWALGLWLVVALSLGALSGCLAGRSNTVEIGEANIPSGQRALVPITIANVTSPKGLGGYTFSITFDPSVVQVVSVAGGDPPFDDVLASNINNTEGQIAMVSVQGGTLNGPRGPITVANLEVEAVGARGAVSTLGLHVTELIDTYGDRIGAHEVSGKVRVR